MQSDKEDPTPFHEDIQEGLRAWKEGDPRGLAQVASVLREETTAATSMTPASRALVGSDLPDLLETASNVIHKKESHDLLGLLEAVASALRTLEASPDLDGLVESAETVRGCCAGLREVLGEKAPAVVASPAGGGETALDLRGASLHRTAAVFIGLEPTDRSDAEVVLTRLRGLSDDESMPEQARSSLRKTADKITDALRAEGPPAEAAMEEARLLLEQAVEFLESEGTDSPTKAEDAKEVAGAGQARTAAPSGPSVQFDGPAILPADTDPELLTEAAEEFLDHLGLAESALLALEEDPAHPEHINTVFRAFHTVKGSSSFLGLDRIQRLAHLAENLLSRARNGEVTIQGDYANLSLQSCDVLRAVIEGLANVEPGQALDIPEEYGDLLERLASADASREAGKSAGSGTPSAAPARPTIPMDEPRTSAASPPPPASAPAPAPAEVEAPRPSPPPPPRKKEIQPQAKKKPSPNKGTKSDTTVRVGTGRLDSLINMVGELVIAHSMIVQDPGEIGGESPADNRKISHLGKITRELQDLSMALRMVPLKPMFEKMRRVIRDLAQRSGKSVVLVTAGEDTEIDRNMVEGINDPLVHMIRNSVDHGIESAEERREKGKPMVGTLTLRAFHSAGNVIIEVQDDGRGLDRDKILAKAIEKDVIQSGRNMSDSEVYELIFRAGFSTAEKVTDVSGRGVGMDVVKRGIEALRGRVGVASTIGEGTTITLQFPLTMAIVDAMLIVAGNEKYLLPTMSIQQSFHPDASDINTLVGRGEMVKFRDGLVPIVRLHEVLDIESARDRLEDGILIVVEVPGSRYALLVDRILGQHQVVTKSLGPVVGQVSGISGGAILGDGHVGLILDAKGILNLSRGEYARA